MIMIISTLLLFPIIMAFILILIKTKNRCGLLTHHYQFPNPYNPNPLSTLSSRKKHPTHHQTQYTYILDRHNPISTPSPKIQSTSSSTNYKTTKKHSSPSPSQTNSKIPSKVTANSLLQCSRSKAMRSMRLIRRKSRHVKGRIMRRRVRIYC